MTIFIYFNILLRFLDYPFKYITPFYNNFIFNCRNAYLNLIKSLWLLLLKYWVTRMWIRFDYKVGFGQGDNDPKKRPDDFYWLWLGIFTILLAIAILLKYKQLIVCTIISISFNILCILYYNNHFPDYGFLKRLFLPQNMALKLINPFLCLFPFWPSIILKIGLICFIIWFFSKELNIHHFIPLLFSASIGYIYNYIDLSQKNYETLHIISI